MSMPPQPHFRPRNPRYNDNRPCLPPSNLAWMPDDRNSYPASTHNDQQPQLLTSQLFQKHQLISVLHFFRTFAYRKYFISVDRYTIERTWSVTTTSTDYYFPSWSSRLESSIILIDQFF